MSKDFDLNYTKPTRPELLAPVGGWEALLAAVENGADAVYLGGKQFSARSSAENFDREEMARAVDYVHLRGARIYVTVNTILDDSELQEGLNYLRFLYETGVDAVILQDLGVARLVSRALPELEIHASTQMTVHNLPGVQLMKDLGFQRVVLSREVSLDNINYINENTPVELESFIHGALCISYSGECLMSSLIGGRSGNRGRCAQPCRLTYSLVDDRGQVLTDEKIGHHLLSPRDLNSIEFLPELIKAGIDSFKIEGRMKRPEYVATVIRIYRQALDRLLTQGENNVPDEDKRELRQIFNRDFTSGYYFGNPGVDLMSYKRPNNRGLRLGRIASFNPREKTVEILLEDQLRIGDGLEIWVTQGGRQGITVNRMTSEGRPVESAAAGEKVTIDLPGKTSVGDRVFKTYDAELMARARHTFEAAKYGRKIPLQVKVEVRLGEPLLITLRDDLGNQTKGQTKFLAEAALKRPLTDETIYKQIDRMGNTPFAVTQFTTDIQGELMVPVSEINEARRQAVEQLEALRLKAWQRDPISDSNWQKRFSSAFLVDQTRTSGQYNGHRSTAQMVLSTAVSSYEALKAAVDNGANRIYLGGESFKHQESLSTEVLKKGLAYCRAKGAEFVLSTPRVLQDDELAGYWPKVKELVWQVDGILAANFGLIKLLLSEQGQAANSTDENLKHRLNLMADYSLNVYNQQSLACLAELGFQQATLSPELTLTQIMAMQEPQHIAKECLVHGAIPMMISEYCAVGCTLGGRKTGEKCKVPCKGKKFGLKDRMNFVFPVAMDQFCHLHIFNPKELCVIEELSSLAEAGIQSIRLELKLKEAREVGQITKIYREELERYAARKAHWEPAEKAKQALAALSPAGLTKGHYFRGVL